MQVQIRVPSVNASGQYLGNGVPDTHHRDLILEVKSCSLSLERVAVVGHRPGQRPQLARPQTRHLRPAAVYSMEHILDKVA